MLGHLDLTDEQTAALLRELDRIIVAIGTRSRPRVRTLKEIRALIKPYLVSEPLPPIKPPSKGRYGRRH